MIKAVAKWLGYPGLKPLFYKNSFCSIRLIRQKLCKNSNILNVCYLTDRRQVRRRYHDGVPGNIPRQMREMLIMVEGLVSNRTRQMRQRKRTQMLGCLIDQQMFDHFDRVFQHISPGASEHLRQRILLLSNRQFHPPDLPLCSRLLFSHSESIMKERVLIEVSLKQINCANSHCLKDWDFKDLGSIPR